MLKILVIGALLAVFLYYSFRRLKHSLGLSATRIPKKGYIPIPPDPADTRRAIRSTLVTVVTGFVLLLVTVLLGIKIKILFLLLPISCYLIGQIFLLANQMNAIRHKSFWFNPSLSSLWIEQHGGDDVVINLYQDLSSVSRCAAVQQNRSVLFGYYELKTIQGITIRLPSLLAENRQNSFFFDTLEQHFQIKEHKSLFPIL